MPLLILLCLLSFSPITLSNEQVIPDKPTTPAVNFKLSVEIEGLEQVSKQHIEAINKLSQSIDALAHSPSLSEADKAFVADSINQLNQTVIKMGNTLATVPQVLDKASEPIVDKSHDFIDTMMLYGMLTLLLIITLVVVALLTFYQTTVRPSLALIKQMKADRQRLSENLKTASTALATVSQANNKPKLSRYGTGLK